MRIPKVQQRVECTLPGYDWLWVDAWVNAPQKVHDEWQAMREDLALRDEEGNIVYQKDEETGETRVDPETYEPLPRIDVDKVKRLSTWFLSTFVLATSLTEDMDGEPLSLSDPDFLDRVPEDIVEWLYKALNEAILDRKKRVKNASTLLSNT